MQLQEVITNNPETIRPDDTIRDAALIMRERHIGFLPVVENGNLLGVITDRDLVIRAIAGGYDCQATTIRQIMTRYPVQLKASDPFEKALETMASNAISRLVVTDDQGSLVGVITSGDAATACCGDDRAGKLRADIHKRAHRPASPPPPPDAQFVSD